MRERDEQTLRRGFELWNRRDFESLAEIFHPEIEIDATNRVLNPARYHGIEGFERLTQEVFDIWEEWSIEPTRFLWNGNRALIETRVTARGKGSGIAARGDVLLDLDDRGRKGHRDGAARRSGRGLRVGRPFGRPLARPLASPSARRDS